MKKVFFMVLVLMLVFTSASSVWAISGTRGDNSVGREIFENAKRMSKEELESENIDVLFSMDSSGSCLAKPIFEKDGIKSAPTYTYQIVCYYNFLNSWATATSSSTVPIDYIYARSKTYGSSGGLLDTAEDSATNASYAGAVADNTSGSNVGDFAYGHHVFKYTGYVDIVRETYDEW